MRNDCARSVTYNRLLGRSISFGHRLSGRWFVNKTVDVSGMQYLRSEQIMRSGVGETAI